jgi:hypothetical protein
MIDVTHSSTLRDKLIYYLILLLGVSIPLSLNTDKFITIILAVAALTICLFSKKQINITKSLLLSILLPIIYFFMLLIGTIYSEDVSFAFSKIETSLPLVLLPSSLAVFMLYFKFQLNINRILKFYSATNLFTFCYACINLLVTSEQYTTKT